MSCNGWIACIFLLLSLGAQAHDVDFEAMPVGERPQNVSLYYPGVDISFPGWTSAAQSFFAVQGPQDPVFGDLMDANYLGSGRPVDGINQSAPDGEGGDILIKFTAPQKDISMDVLVWYTGGNIPALVASTYCDHVDGTGANARYPLSPGAKSGTYSGTITFPCDPTVGTTQIGIAFSSPEGCLNCIEGPNIDNLRTTELTPPGSLTAPSILGVSKMFPIRQENGGYVSDVMYSLDHEDNGETPYALELECYEVVGLERMGLLKHEVYLFPAGVTFPYSWKDDGYDLGTNYSCRVRFGSIEIREDESGWGEWSNWKEILISPPLTDTDHDGLPDSWETSCAIGAVSFEAYGGCPHPEKKDIYLWIDELSPPVVNNFKEYNELTDNAVQKIKEAFELHGVNLHVWRNQKTPKEVLAAGLDWAVSTDDVEAGLMRYKKAFGFYGSENSLSVLRDHVYHYALYGKEYSYCDEITKSSGVSSSEHNALFISGLNASDDMWTAGTLMHELGHNLGLDHGGAKYPVVDGRPNTLTPFPDSHVNFKPNHISIMNYLFQGPWLKVFAPSGSSIFDAYRYRALRLDYAVKSYQTISELTKQQSGEITEMKSDGWGLVMPEAAKDAVYMTVIPCGNGKENAGSSSCQPLYSQPEPLDRSSRLVRLPFDVNSIGFQAVVYSCDNYEANRIDANADKKWQDLHSYTDWDNLNYFLGPIGAGFGSAAGSERQDFSEYYQEQVVGEAPVETLFVPQDYSADLSVFLSRRDAEPTNVVRHQFILRNTGLKADTYDLTLIHDPGWTTTISIPSTITLAPGASKVFYGTTTVPTGQSLGDQGHVSLIATGRNYGNDDSADIWMTVATNLPTDTDGDGLPDASDPNPASPDADGDGLLDINDPNPNQAEVTVVDPFAFTARTGVAPDTLIESDPVVVSGPTIGVGIAIAGGQYSIDGGDFTRLPGTVRAGQSVVVRVQSAATTSTTVSALLNIGGETASFDVTTVQVLEITGPSITGEGDIKAELSGGGPNCGFARTDFVPADSPPEGVSFPYGLFDFVATNCTGTITLTITYPSDLPADSLYWKYGPTLAGADGVEGTDDDRQAHWYLIPAILTGNQAIFSITDGGLGDDDLSVNRIILDQGGPGVLDGGVANAVPSMSNRALLFLAALLTLIALVSIYHYGMRVK